MYEVHTVCIYVCMYCMYVGMYIHTYYYSSLHDLVCACVCPCAVGQRLIHLVLKKNNVNLVLIRWVTNYSTDVLTYSTR